MADLPMCLLQEQLSSPREANAEESHQSVIRAHKRKRTEDHVEQLGNLKRQRQEESHQSVKRAHKRKRTKDHVQQLGNLKRQCQEESHQYVKRAHKRSCTEDHVEQLGNLKRQCQERSGGSGSSTETCLHHESLHGISQTCDCVSEGVEKPILVLDLDHTLMNSTHPMDLSRKEKHYIDRIFREKNERMMLHRLEFEDCCYLVKLRPFVRQFLQELNNLFDLYIYTMGTRRYATEIVKILDPQNVLFPSKVITRHDSTQKGVKALDIVPGSKGCTVILDDLLSVWRQEDRRNVIKMRRYNYFQSSCVGIYSGCQSLASKKIDEREFDGTLASVLSVLKGSYLKFVHMDRSTAGLQPDFRRILKEIRREILKGCVIAFIGAPPDHGRGWQPLQKVAERLGAKCSVPINASVTHILAKDSSVRAKKSGKIGRFLVHTSWLETAWDLWHRPREDQFLLVPPA